MIKLAEVYEEMEGRIMVRGLADELEKLGFRLGPFAKKLMTSSPRALRGRRGKLTMTQGVAASSPRAKIRQALQAQGVKTAAVQTARRLLIQRALAS